MLPYVRARIRTERVSFVDQRLSCIVRQAWKNDVQPGTERIGAIYQAEIHLCVDGKAPVEALPGSCVRRC